MKNNLAAEITKCRILKLWCDIKLVAWCLYFLLHIIVVPAGFVLMFKDTIPLLAWAAVPIIYIEINFISKDSHPLNVKIKQVEKCKTEIDNKLYILKAESDVIE